MKLFLIFIILFFLLSAITLAYQINIDPSQLIIQPCPIQGLRDYSAIYLNNKNACGLQVKSGEPALPGYIVQVALPPGMDIDSVDVSYAEPEIIQGYYKIAPQQKPKYEDEKFELVPPNKEIYSSSNIFPGKITYCWQSGNASGYQLGEILFAPVQYNPLVGQIVFYKKIDFNLNLRSSTKFITYPKYRIDWIEKQLHDEKSRQVINPYELIDPPTTDKWK